MRKLAVVLCGYLFVNGVAIAQDGVMSAPDAMPAPDAPLPIVPEAAPTPPPARPPVITVTPGGDMDMSAPANIMPLPGPTAAARNGANLRVSPSIKANVVATLRGGTIVTRLATLEIGEFRWWKADVEGIGEGWIPERELREPR